MHGDSYYISKTLHLRDPQHYLAYDENSYEKACRFNIFYLLGNNKSLILSRKFSRGSYALYIQHNIINCV